MGRQYAGILGPLAMILVIVRGIASRAGTESTLASAALALLLLGAAGFVFGELAAWIVEDSVRTKVANEIAALDAARAKTKTK